MDNESKKIESVRKDFMRKIKTKATQRIDAQNEPIESAWSGLGFFGLIGWSIVVPTLIGTAIGIWLDHHYKGNRSWTLILLVAGLVMGCFTASHWISKEYRKIRIEKREKKENDI